MVLARPERRPATSAEDHEAGAGSGRDAARLQVAWRRCHPRFAETPPEAGAHRLALGGKGGDRVDDAHHGTLSCSPRPARHLQPGDHEYRLSPHTYEFEMNGKPPYSRRI